MDCFIVERRHLLVKGIADFVDNTTTFEQTVMSGILNNSMRQVRELQPGDSLLGRTAPFPGCPGVDVTDKLSSKDAHVCRGDVVSLSGNIGVVQACCREGDGTLSVLVETTAARRRLSPHSIEVLRTGQVEAWVADSIVPCIAWKNVGARELGELLVLCR